MWLKYQQVTAKMASFAPGEFMRNRDMEVTTKHPLKRFEPTLRTSLRVVIPMNLDRLRKHKSNIEKYAYSKNWKDLNMEQINASRTVQQLQATIRDLDKLQHQIHEQDLEAFEKQMNPMKKQAIKAIQEFGQVQNLIATEVHKSIQETQNQSNEIETHPLDTSYSNHETDALNTSSSMGADIFSEVPMCNQIQVQDDHQDLLKDEIAACQSWDQLRDGLLELNTLVQDFAVVVHQQQETVDRIEDNIESAHQNVNAGTTFLAQASKYKAAMIPVAGAIVGGLIAGPIGLLAGFKLAGAAAAVGGGVAGYQGGKYLKKKHDSRVDMELDNLSKPDDSSKKVI